MSAVTVSYGEQVPYADRRPMAPICLYGPRSTEPCVMLALVDTGADFLHLPDEAAQAVGIDLTDSEDVHLLTAGGYVSMRQTTVSVKIAGVVTKVPCNFGPQAKPLLGRQALFAVLETTGFSTTHWLLDARAPTSGVVWVSTSHGGALGIAWENVSRSAG